MNQRIRVLFFPLGAIIASLLILTGAALALSAGVSIHLGLFVGGLIRKPEPKHTEPWEQQNENI